MQKSPQHRDVPTSQRHNMVMSQRRDVTGKSQQALSLGEAIKGTGEFTLGGSKYIGRARA